MAGVYLHVIFDKKNHEVFWLCVGAGMDVKSRTAQHHKFRYVPSRACLHYHIWNSPGRGDFFILLGGFKHVMKDPNFDGKDQPSMNNLLEEWSCLVWQTLPFDLLSKALPPDIVVYEANIHLNRASPLRQKYNCHGVREGNIGTAIELSIGARNLLLSPDPEIRAYMQAREKHYDLPYYRKLEGLRLGHSIQESTNFQDITLMLRKRENFDFNRLMRNADSDQGDNVEVWICCRAA